MATAEQVTNPNSNDLPPDQHVMSPRVATARREDDDEGNPMLNGNHPPLRGTQDLDGETTLPTPVEEASEGVQRSSAPAPSTRVPEETMRRDLTAQPTVDPGTKAGSMGRPPASLSVGARPVDHGAESIGLPAGGGSMLSGVFRAVQTLPAAVENLVTRSGSGRAIPDEPGTE